MVTVVSTASSSSIGKRCSCAVNTCRSSQVGSSGRGTPIAATLPCAPEQAVAGQFVDLGDERFLDGVLVRVVEERGRRWRRRRARDAWCGTRRGWPCRRAPRRPARGRRTCRSARPGCRRTRRCGAGSPSRARRRSGWHPRPGRPPAVRRGAGTVPRTRAPAHLGARARDRSRPPPRGSGMPSTRSSRRAIGIVADGPRRRTPQRHRCRAAAPPSGRRRTARSRTLQRAASTDPRRRRAAVAGVAGRHAVVDLTGRDAQVEVLGPEHRLLRRSEPAHRLVTPREPVEQQRGRGRVHGQILLRAEIGVIGVDTDRRAGRDTQTGRHVADRAPQPNPAPARRPRLRPRSAAARRTARHRRPTPRGAGSCRAAGAAARRAGARPRRAGSGGSQPPRAHPSRPPGSRRRRLSGVRRAHSRYTPPAARFGPSSSTVP